MNTRSIKLLITLILTIQILGCSNESSTLCVFDKYDKFQRTAMLKYTEGNYEEAVEYFESAFNVKNDENENDYVYAAAAALRIEEYSKAKEFIKDAIVIKNANQSYFENFEGFDSFRNLDELKQINKNYESYQNKYLKSQPIPELNNKMDILIEHDQSVRTNSSSTEEMMKQDSLNVKRLIEITKEYGWQDKSWLILWHQRGTFTENSYPQTYFRPLIDSLIDICEIRPDYWTRYEDENLMFSEGVQKYGTYWNNYEDFPLIDVETIDEVRNEVGLPPLWYMNKVYNANLPNGYIASNK